MIEQNQANSWPTTRARIDEVEVVRQSDDEYYPTVSYTYSVGNKTYTGTTVWMGAPQLFKNVPQASAVCPGIGEMTKVSYDPSDPENCTLRTDGRVGLFSTTSGRWGLSFAALGGLLMLIAFFKNRAIESWHSA